VEGISTVVTVVAFLAFGLGERERDLRGLRSAAAGERCLARPLGAGERERARSLVEMTSRKEAREVGLNGSDESTGDVMSPAWAYLAGAAAEEVSLDSADRAKLVVMDGGG